MVNKLQEDKQKRLKEIEDRKIEILVEIGQINKSYGEEISKLRSEYIQLDKEYYSLKLELMIEKSIL
ncbi:MAG: hypothetical protein JSV56_04400 [Methanomassiliicoccales archaeon]|nr:MAG: hypothetical protein JSV56_04400 [Methanomassiliicoccales archaeon]